MATNAHITGAPTCASPTHEMLDLAQLGQRIQSHVHRIDTLARSAIWFLDDLGAVPRGAVMTAGHQSQLSAIDTLLVMLIEAAALADADGEDVEGRGLATARAAQVQS